MSSPRNWVVFGVLVVFATCAVVATASQQQTQAGPAYKKVGSWGKLGTGNGQFGANAFGLATDKSGNVYVADTDNHRIQVFTAKGAFVRKLAFPASESVSDVATDPDGNVWGTSNQGARAQQFSKAGAPLASIKTASTALGVAVDAGGNVYVAGSANGRSVQRFDKAAGGFEPGQIFGGLTLAYDVEVSPDGSVYVSDVRNLNVKRYDGSGKLLKTVKGGVSAPIGIGVDLDCNLWMTNISQRRLDQFSPSGKPLGTVASPDLIAQDVAVGPTGDLYAFDGGTRSIIHFAEDRSKPQAANVIGLPAVAKTAKGYVARIKYALTGVACPAQLDATASLAGKGIAGSAHVKVGAGKTTVIEIPLARGALKKVAGTSAAATFKIVLKTNGRPTTQTSSIKLKVPANAK